MTTDYREPTPAELRDQLPDVNLAVLTAASALRHLRGGDPGPLRLLVNQGGTLAVWAFAQLCAAASDLVRDDVDGILDHTLAVIAEDAQRRLGD
jgi:hypothetical protein